jgi:methenyltetrahydromethanopterin cyclohydrolase
MTEGFAEHYRPVTDKEIINRVIEQYLELRKQGFERAQAQVVISDLVKGVGSYEVGRILTKYAAGESIEEIAGSPVPEQEKAA